MTGRKKRLTVWVGYTQRFLHRKMAVFAKNNDDGYDESVVKFLELLLPPFACGIADAAKNQCKSN
jgi:hypothetical protein